MENVKIEIKLSPRPRGLLSGFSCYQMTFSAGNRAAVFTG
jgi:hypothetical protein